MGRLADRLKPSQRNFPYAGQYGNGPGYISQSFMQSYNGQDANSANEKAAWNDFFAYALNGYERNGVVFSLLEARRRLFTDARFIWRATQDKKLFGTDALALLEEPWPNGQTNDLLGRMIQYADLAGNAFVWKVPGRLVLLRPDWVSIISNEVELDDGSMYRDVIGYLYYPNGAFTDVPKLLEVDEVAHWAPIPDPLAQWRGMSWLTPVLRDINSDISMLEHKMKYFKNAATPNLLIKYVQPVDTKVLEDLQLRLHARHGGADNAWKTLVLDNGADVSVIGNNFEQMAFPQVQAAGEVRIASAAGVPPIVAGLAAGLDSATYSNYVQAWRAMADGTMHNLWRTACGALAKLVDVPAGAELWFDIRDIPAMRDADGDRQAANQLFAAAASALITAGFDGESVVRALVAGDMSLLTHTGAVPVQLYPNGQAPTGPDNKPAQALKEGNASSAAGGEGT